jgi:hypothetical protein
MAIVCRQCGRHNVDGAQFCANPECGAYLPWVGPANPPTQPAPVSGGAVPRRQPIGDAQSAAASLTLSDATLAATPGESATTTATIHNGGTQVEQFALRVEGPTAPWATVEPSALTVYPNSRAEATIRLAPPRLSSTAPGRAPFTVRAASVLHPGLNVGAVGTLAVGSFRGVAATITPQGTSGRWKTVHGVEVVNTGNVVEPVSLRAGDPGGKLHFAVPGGELPLPPGRHLVNVPVRPILKIFGKPVQYPFQVTVTPRPQVPPIRLDANREAVPLIAGWIAKAVTAVVLLGVAALALTLVGPKLGIFNASATASASPTAGATTGGPSIAVVPPPPSPSPAGASPTPPPSKSPPPSPTPQGPSTFEMETLVNSATVDGQAHSNLVSVQPNCCNITWQAGAQALFAAPEANRSVTYRFQIKAKGKYDLKIAQTSGPTYGIYTITLDNSSQPLGDPFDAYSPAVEPLASQDFGQHSLGSGSHKLTITITGKNDLSQSFFAGLDFIVLTPVDN